MGPNLHVKVMLRFKRYFPWLDWKLICEKMMEPDITMYLGSIFHEIIYLEEATALTEHDYVVVS